MKLEIITPEKILYQGEITKISLPGKSGSFSLLENHAPFITSLQEGDAMVHTADNNVVKLTINGGFVEINNNRVVLCVEDAVEEK